MRFALLISIFLLPGINCSDIRGSIARRRRGDSTDSTLTPPSPTPPPSSQSTDDTNFDGSNLTPLLAEVTVSDFSNRISDNSSHILFGTEVDPPLKYEFMVFLQNGVEFCGGVVISTHWVLTAAHCVCGLYVLGANCSWRSTISDGSTDVPGFLYVHNRTNLDIAQRIEFDDFEIHPDYSGVPYTYDIALLHSQNPFPAPPIELGSGDDSDIGTPVTALGWGSISSDENLYSDVLLETNVEILDIHETGWITLGSISDHQMAVGKKVEGEFTAVCKGDSGGPLFIDADGKKPKLVGLVSSGRITVSCADPEFPTVFIDVTHREIEYFIREVTGDSNSNSLDQICLLPVDTGPCRALFPMWYYDSQQQECTPFAYGGCAGNENRFESLEDCQDLCWM